MAFWNIVKKVVAHSASLPKNNIDLIENLNNFGLDCTSCEACFNACRFGALTMRHDELGFLVPVIDSELCKRCGKCLNVCPPVNAKHQNSPNPPVFAFACKSDSEKERSASGAAFAMLAKATLKDGGSVVGACMSQDWLSSHLTMVDDEEGLNCLRGSKYIQSEAGDIYNKTKVVLDKGKPVLFSGLPCQVAALKSFLGRDYSNLLTVDLLCHSAPSPIMYQRFIDEVTKGKKIKYVSFRPQELPWGEYGIKIAFDDESSELVPAAKCSFLRGYFATLYSKQSCNNCKFQATPRQGDLTIGDCWGIQELYPDWNTKKGVSAVFINNDKGKNAFNAVRDDADIRPVGLDFMKSHNRVSPYRRTHLSQRRFLDELLPSMSFSRAVDMALGWKFDVAISGGWCVVNYGGALSYYALYSVCRDLGFHPIMVESHLLPPAPTPKPAVFRESPYPFYNVSRVHKSLDDMRELNRRVMNFLVGSDQVWNHSFEAFSMAKSGRAYNFAYAASWRKRIAYATSFGSIHFLGDAKDKEVFAKELKKFDYVSVREDAGVKICRDEFGVNAEKKADPVFLCDPSHYDRLAEKSNLNVKANSLVSYMIWPDSVKATPRILTEIATAANCKNVIAIGDAKSAAERSKKSEYPFLRDIKAEDWLHCFKSAQFIVTDSFHAVCFSIIFKKNFVFVQSESANMEHGLDRLISLLQSLGLESRLVKGIKNVSESDAIHGDIDYGAVYEKLSIQVDDGIRWLRMALSTPKEIRNGE